MIGVFSFFLFILLLMLGDAVYAATGYRVNNGSNSGWFEAADGVRTRIYNNTGQPIFVPNKSSNEIASLKTTFPAVRHII